MTRSASSRQTLLPFLPIAALFLFAACGGGTDPGGGNPSIPGPDLFQVVAGPATVGFTPVVASGQLVAFLADEATSGVDGTDFNGNGNLNDTVPVVVDSVARVESNLAVASSQMVWAGQHLYYVVDELVDGREWIGAGLGDLVLVHWTPGGISVAVAALDRRGSTQLVSNGTNVFFQMAGPVPGPSATTIGMVSTAAPLTVVPVLSDDAAGGLSPTLVGIDEDLLFFSLDEVVHTRDLNSDMDAFDGSVIALMEAGGAVTGGMYTGIVRNTHLASFSASSPYRAKRASSGANDWLVGLLVSEAAQGNTNFNTFQHPDIPASWVPTHCATQDTDTDDDVLHFLNYAEWTQNAMASPPRNTGLVGKNRVLIVDDFLGTISQESIADVGFGEPCDLNGDGDRMDDIFRWVRAVTPILPPRDVSQLFPPGNVPGGTFGVAELGSRWVLAASEAQDDSDLNGDGEADLDILGWYAPASSMGWTFDSGVQGTPSFAAATWIGELPGRERLGVAFSELGNAVDLNNNGTITDSLATFAFFDEEAVRLSFPGFAVATQASNAGTVIQNGWGFYRVSEFEDGTDLNGNGTITDFLLWRSQLTDGATVAMAVMNDVGRRAIDPSDDLSASVGAFTIDESRAGDANMDGREDGFALVYFAWPQ